MDFTKKLKIAMVEMNTTQIELARRTNQVQETLSRKMRFGRYKITEYEKLVTALGCTLEVNIILPDGRKV